MLTDYNRNYPLVMSLIGNLSLKTSLKGDCEQESGRDLDLYKNVELRF